MLVGLEAGGRGGDASAGDGRVALKETVGAAGAVHEGEGGSEGGGDNSNLAGVAVGGAHLADSDSLGTISSHWGVGHFNECSNIANSAVTESVGGYAAGVVLAVGTGLGCSKGEEAEEDQHE